MAGISVFTGTGVVVDDAVDIKFFYLVFGVDEVLSQSASRSNCGCDANLTQGASKRLRGAGVVRQGDVTFAAAVVVVVIAIGRGITTTMGFPSRGSQIK